jgi:hypothetical protein
MPSLKDFLLGPCVCACCWLTLTGLPGRAAPGAPAPTLHQQIDQAIAAGRPEFARLAAPPASDAEFVRRVYLDLTGVIPPAADVRAFLKDATPDKRQRLIDRLLASPEHARHLQQVFDVLLMDRRPDKHVPRAAWQEFLRRSFADNKPWDQLVREILSADGSDPQSRPAARFYLDREGEPHLLTRDVGRLFLGMNLQCAQCHNHPQVRGYPQDLYYGLFAFFNRSFLFADKAKPAVFAEKADGEATYQNVFDTEKVTKTGRPHVPRGPELNEPALEKGKEYAVAPAPGVRPVPRYSRRAQVAAQVASAASVPFKRNIANRLWAMMMGRGLVHPLDMDHADNPPSHPELLTLLADELAVRKFDVRWFLRELALSQAYQRSSQPPAGVPQADPAAFAVAALKPLSAEQLAWSVMQATGLSDAERQALGKNLSEPALYAKLAGNIAPFVATFGGPPGQPGHGFEATVDQALFLTNGALVRGWLAPRAGNLADRLGRLQEATAVAEELFLSVLSRPPTAEEQRDVADYLRQRARDRTTALQELVGVLLTSAEFRFNH